MADAKNGQLLLSLTIVVTVILLLMTRAAPKMDDESNVDCMNPLDSPLKKSVGFFNYKKKHLIFFILSSFL